MKPTMFASERLREVQEGRMRGSLVKLKVRAKVEEALANLGRFIQRHSGYLLMLGFVVMISCSCGLVRFRVETDAEKLWVEVGGALQKELKYTKEAMKPEHGVSAELLIQTPNMKGTNILNVEAMKHHLATVMEATKVTVTLNAQTWTLKDICYTPTQYEFGIKELDQGLRKLLPCAIVTPLDCFWDGAKIHGPDGNVSLGLDGEPDDYRWTKLDPREMFKLFRDYQAWSGYKSDWFIEMFEEAGITSGYLEKPCLDPEDPECPDKSKMSPDIGVELSDGCRGFASKLMHWPEQLIVGDAKKNSSGTIRSASALQTIIPLMQAEELYDYWFQQDHDNWSLDTARTVLKAWQQNFTQTINADGDANSEYTILAFSSSTFSDLLREFSQTSVFRLALGYILMVIYACITLKRWRDAVASQGALGFAGVLLVTLSVMAGLGFCSWIGISFNAASTQVLPFLALGLGVDDMFVLAHTYISMAEKGAEYSDNVVADCLKRSGMSVLLTSFTNMFAFSMAALIPIPALRMFALQAAVIVVFNCLAVMLLFPAMIGLDASRKDALRLDFCCCIQYTLVSSMLDQTTNISGVSISSSHSASADQDSLHTSSVSSVCLPGAAFTIQTTSHAGMSWNHPAVRDGRLHGEAPGPDMSTIQARENQGFPEILSTCAMATSASTTTSASASASASVNSGHCESIVQLHLPGSVPGCCDPMIPSPIAPGGGGFHKKNDNHTAQHKSSKGDLHCGKLNRFLSGDSSLSCTTCIASGAPSKNVQIHLKSTAQSSGETTFAQSEISTHSVSPSRTQQVTPSQQTAWGPHTPLSSNRSRSVNSVWNVVRGGVDHLSLSYFAKTYYAPWLQKDAVKLFALFLCAGLFGASVYGCMQVEDGLDMSDLLPRSSHEHKFIEKQFQYFSYYRMFGITKGEFDYANGQAILYKYHDAFKTVSNIVKTEEMELPRFWLMYFRDWLKDLQVAFDDDWAKGAITYETYHDNASDSGVLAYKLLAQTGDPNIPPNRAQVRKVKLVNEEGIIRPEAFYHCLTAWHTYDPMGYSVSQANIQPEPLIRKDLRYLNGMKIDPSQPITFSMLPFDLIDLVKTEDFTTVIKDARAICQKFSEEHGLPNYPMGVPFTFWEQYMWLREHLLQAVVIVLVTSFAVMAVALLNIWAATINVLFLMMITTELFGFMGLWNIKLSAVPAVTLILSVGVGVEFTVHMCTAFLSAVGDRNKRMSLAVEQVFSPIFAGGFSTFLGVVMLAGSEFDFIVRYFFDLLLALILIGTINGLLLLPVTLSYIGPKAEVEEIRARRSAPSSATPSRELLPSSACGRSSAPTESELCIVSMAETDTHESRRAHHERYAEKRSRHESKHSTQRGGRGSKQGRTKRTSPRHTDSESSGHVLETTLIVKVRSGAPAERARPNPRGGWVSGAFIDNEVKEKESSI